jgi:predicted transcriptional regulator
MTRRERKILRLLRDMDATRLWIVRQFLWRGATYVAIANLIDRGLIRYDDKERTILTITSTGIDILKEMER